MATLATAASRAASRGFSGREERIERTEIGARLVPALEAIIAVSRDLDRDKMAATAVKRRLNGEHSRHA